MVDTDPLPPDIATIVRSAREPLPMDEARAEAFARRLDLAIVAGECLAATAVTASTIATKSATAIALGKIAAVLSRKATIAVAMLGIGAGAGAAVHATFTGEPPAAPAPSTLAAAPSAPALSARSLAPEPATDGDAAKIAHESSGVPLGAPSAAAPSVRAAAPGTSSTGTATSPSRLAEERAALEMGRTALARGDADGALAAATAHERTFPRGALTEEREVLVVQALAAKGHDDLARARARRFVERYPNSIFGGAVRATVGEP